MSTMTGAREDASLARARDIHKWAAEIRWTGGAPAEVTRAQDALADIIEIAGALRAETLSWELYDATLSQYSDPHDAALTESADEAEELADYLAEVVGLALEAATERAAA